MTMITVMATVHCSSPSVSAAFLVPGLRNTFSHFHVAWSYVIAEPRSRTIDRPRWKVARRTKCWVVRRDKKACYLAARLLALVDSKRLRPKRTKIEHPWQVSFSPTEGCEYIHSNIAMNCLRPALLLDSRIYFSGCSTLFQGRHCA